MSRPVYIIGAGAIGAFFAARLSPFAPTTLVVRDAARDALSQGVLLQGAIQEPGFRQLNIRSWTQIGSFEPEAMIWVACKIFDLPKVLEEIRLRMDSSQSVVLCQNGIGVAELAYEQLPRSTVARAVCWFGIRKENLPEQKRAILHVAGIDSMEFAFPAEHSQSAARFSALMQACGIPPVSVAEGVEAVEWRKGLWNVSANGLCALAEATNGAAADDPLLNPIANALYDEALAVALSREVPIGPEIRDRAFEGMRRTGTNLNSTLMDLWAGRKTEMDWLNGAVVRMADEKGLSCPTHRTILHLIRSLEASQARRKA